MKNLDVELLYTIVSLISLTGCFWHLSDVSKIYFSYETNVNVKFERDVMVQIPGITICTNTTFAVSEEFIDKRFAHLKLLPNYKEAKHYYLHKMLMNLTLDEQLNEATVDYRKVFHSCSVLSPLAFEHLGKDYIDCDQVAPIYQSINYAKKCFSITLQLKNESEDKFLVDHDTTLRDNGFPLFQINLNNQYLDDMIVFIHSRNKPFLGFIGGQTNGIHLNISKYSGSTLSYVKTTAQLLPPPYKTMCRDYNSIGFKTLSHCIVSCKANYFVKKFKGWHPDIPANENYQLKLQYADLELKENKTLDKLMGEECLNVCSKMADCFSEYYSVSIIGQFGLEDFCPTAHCHSDEHSYGIFIYLPTGLDTSYVHSPRLHFIEYICYFASVFSLWFGFSIIALSRFLIHAIHHYRKRRSIKQRKNQSIKTETEEISSTIDLK